MAKHLEAGRAVALAGALAGLLVACTAKAPVAPKAPGESPTRVHPVGMYRHEFTRLELPERQASFERLYVTEYDPAQSDVSGHYHDATIPSVATVYHYPANADASPPTREAFLAHFERTKADVTQANPGARLVDSGGVEATINGFRLVGGHARFRLAGHPALSGPADSHLYLFALDGWYLKFRFSHPEDAAESAMQSEHAFIAAFEWPVPGRDGEPAPGGPEQGRRGGEIPDASNPAAGPGRAEGGIR